MSVRLAERRLRPCGQIVDHRVQLGESQPQLRVSLNPLLLRVIFNRCARALNGATQAFHRLRDFRYDRVPLGSTAVTCPTSIPGAAFPS